MFYSHISSVPAVPVTQFPPLSAWGGEELSGALAALPCLLSPPGCHTLSPSASPCRYNPSLIFWGAWNTLSPLLPPDTRQKILVVGTKERAALIDLVGSAVLPLQYGGEAAGQLAPIS